MEHQSTDTDDYVAQELITEPNAGGVNTPEPAIGDQSPKHLPELPPEMIKKIQKECTIRQRMNLRFANSVWNAVALKSFEAETELILQFRTEGVEFPFVHNFPYMDVQAHEEAQLQEEVKGSVFERDVPHNFTVSSEKTREHHAEAVAMMFPNVQTLHIWSVKTTGVTFRFITALCRLLGPKLITLNLWIEDLEK